MTRTLTIEPIDLSELATEAEPAGLICPCDDASEPPPIAEPFGATEAPAASGVLVAPYFNPDGTGWQLNNPARPRPASIIRVFIHPTLDQIRLAGNVHPYTAAIYTAFLNYGRVCNLGFERVYSPAQAEWKLYGATEAGVGDILVRRLGYRPGTTAPACCVGKEIWLANTNRGKPVQMLHATRFAQHEMMHCWGWTDSAMVNAHDPTACLNQNASAPIRYPVHPRYFTAMGIAGFSLRPFWANGVSEWSWLQAQFGAPWLWMHEASLVK